MKIFWECAKTDSFSPKRAPRFLLNVFLLCKKCPCDRRRNYCFFLLILSSSLQDEVGLQQAYDGSSMPV